MSKEIYMIVGAGRSGIAAAKMLMSLGKSIVIYDGNKALDVDRILEQIGASQKIPFVLGDDFDNALDNVDICVVSPGVPLEVPVMKAIAQRNIPIWSEIELAYRYDKGTVLAITGTNGKTTTTSLTYEIMKAANDKTLLVGNIEIPYTGLALDSCEGGYTVAEISSFQLETMISFKPHVSAILNITPDHLDRHKTMENYIEMKKSIVKNQSEDDFCVLNYEDSVLREFGKTLKCKVVYFSSTHEIENGIYYKDGDIIIDEDGEKTVVLNVRDVNLVGMHNYENIMAAVAITHSAGVSLDIIREVTKKFVAVEHRIEFVTEKHGVRYYNDSKGTNPDAAIKAIDAMPSQTVLIAGGYDKNSDYTEWISHLSGKCKLLLLMGQTRENIAAACEKAGFTAYRFVESMQEAVNSATENAENGDCVLLSPACASWGMFKSYQQRGNMFKECVNLLGD
ncbi:MAG: UDP-N-acetylmuramoyl-L-alanine--D-glutamate ligase [Faecalibacterium sp.]|nr:UDP-N-acetylmuramoyl-L-alanine--D-glutamate ligase [Ruminococcus sp.]MCM1391534.1 UDP-N-acetylmuramoyl-L-alanine--D-glutamate ligase [Ruminococcus sp.]MCM1485972.1 UDP-N-acetylmuramoyl-L-alanine--D-glutamate ligase [Faecalibacterium sp.]